MRTPDEIGTDFARRIFAARGNHAEAHLREEELADICAATAELGATALALLILQSTGRGDLRADVREILEGLVARGRAVTP